MAVHVPYHARSPQVLEVRLGGRERLHDGIAASAWRGAPYIMNSAGRHGMVQVTSGMIKVAARLTHWWDSPKPPMK